MIAQPNGQGGVLAPSSGTQGGVGGPSASAPGGSPKRVVRQRNPNTFAGMQQQGVARPSPSMVQQNPYAMAGVNEGLQQQTTAMAQPSVQPTAQSAVQAAQQTVNNASAGRNLGTYSTSANANALGAPLMQQVMSMLQDPTQGLNDAAASNFDRQNRTLDRDFSSLREGLNENMAARGLDASTVAATKLGELGARQAEAQADVSARIQEQLIRDRSAAMNSAINAAMGLRGQEADMGKDEFTINRDTGQLDFQRGMDEKRFGLDETVGLGNLAINRDNLALSRDRFGFDKSRDVRDFTYQQGRDSKLDDRYDERFLYDQGRDSKMDDRYDERFTYDKGRDTKNDDYRDGRDKVQDRQWDDTYKQNDKNITTQGISAMLSGMGYKNLPRGMIDSILASLGISPSGSNPSGTPGGAPGGNPGGAGNYGGSGDSDFSGDYIFGGSRR